MKNIVINNLFVVYFLLSLVVFTFGIKIIINSNRIIGELHSDKIDLHTSYATLQGFILSHYEFEGGGVGEYSYLYDEESQKWNITSLVGKSPKLFIYVHSPNCRACIDKLIFEMVTIKDFIDKKDLVFFGNFENPRNMKTLKNTYSFIENVYNTVGSNFENLVVDITVPVMFVVDTDLKMNCVYIADKSISPYMTKPYIRTIGKRFFDWDEKLYEINAEHHCSDSNCQHVH